MTNREDYEAAIEEGIHKRAEESVSITVGPVCRNCRHVISFQGLIHCRELDCDCLKPEGVKWPQTRGD